MHSPLVPISEDDLLAYFKAKDINAKCPHCPTIGWQAMENDSGRGVVLTVLGNDGRPNGSAFPIIPLTCRNCGYVWSIARQPIQEWKQANESKES